MSIAIMQPYLFPYLGYFQLINNVKQFVFLDDLSFITGGWINRNKILINGQARYFTLPCKNISQNREINEIEHALDDKTKKKLLRKIKFSYNKAPYFENIYALVESVLYTDSAYISDLAVMSVQECSSYLKLESDFKLSSDHYKEIHSKAADRLIDICKKEGVTQYINPIGGEELYTKEYFRERGVNLQFLKTENFEYDQFGGMFVPDLSIIDIMMFNSPEKIKQEFMNSYTLI